jgi:hypothetical protein
MVRKIPVLLVLAALNVTSFVTIVGQTNVQVSTLPALLDHRPATTESRRGRRGWPGRGSTPTRRPLWAFDALAPDQSLAETVAPASADAGLPRVFGPFCDFAEADAVAWTWESSGFAAQIIPEDAFGRDGPSGWFVNVAVPLDLERSDGGDLRQSASTPPGRGVVETCVLK